MPKDTNNSVFGEINGDNGDREVRSPIYFIPEGEDYRINPIYSLDESTNTPDRFVIVKTTENGKYLQGKMLHYKFRNVDIITESDNAIFVDKLSNTVFVRDYSKALREINPDDPEERQYIILMYNPYDDEDLPQWVSLVGRTACYEYIKETANLYNPLQSIVLTENVAIKDALTVSQFVKHLKNADIIEEDGFNIEDFEEAFIDA